MTFKSKLITLIQEAPYEVDMPFTEYLNELIIQCESEDYRELDAELVSLLKGEV